MKKSEKLKGKAAAASSRRQYMQYALIGVAVVIVLLAAGFLLTSQTMAKEGDTVMVYYTGSLDNGTIFDSNTGRDPLIFRIGNHTVIPGFEQAVVGMKINETKTVIIPADQAYGQHQDSLVQVVNRKNLTGNVTPVVGAWYSITRQSDGAVVRVLVTNVTSDTVTLDANHMLAGQNLTFIIRFAGFYRP